MNLNTEQYFSVAPTVDIPRSVFDRSFKYSTTLNANYLVPIFCKEALPGESWKMSFSMFGRLINPLVVPVADELYVETLWFKCPNRLLWSNWKRFCGEQDNPNDSTDFTIPYVTSDSTTGWTNMTLFDYFGLPTYVPNFSVNSLPLRMYNLTYNQWFRDQNLINSVTVEQGDSDDVDNYTLLKSAKMHDYFTSALPFAQKGDAVFLPVGSEAPVVGNGDALGLNLGNNINSGTFYGTNLAGSANITRLSAGGAGTPAGSTYNYTSTADGVKIGVSTDASKSGLIADLTQSQGISVSDFRFLVQLQKFRERQARSGSRYIEFIYSQFGVRSSDARLQRVEFLGSTRDMVDINTVVQTSQTDNSGTPQGNLSAFGTVAKQNYLFSTSFEEHSYVLGLCRIRHNPIYQQGCEKMWLRKTLYDFYLPVFSHISEQPIQLQQIYAQDGTIMQADGVTPVNEKTFGFQEAWAEYRYSPNMITGKLRSNDPQSLDMWHLAQEFNSAPELNQNFIEENIPMDRVISVSNEPQFLFDFQYKWICASPMPVHSVPGLVDHF